MGAPSLSWSIATFITEHEAEASSRYPDIHYLITLLRASVRASDPQAVNVWAASGFQKAKSAPVAEIVKSLT